MLRGNKLTDMGMTISANTLHNWLRKGKTYLDELVLVLKSLRWRRA